MMEKVLNDKGKESRRERARRNAEQKEMDHDELLRLRRKSKETRLDVYTNNPQPGTLAPYKKGYGPETAHSVDAALSDTDRYMIAKYFPGRVSTPFMSGLTKIPIPTALYQTSFSLSSAVVGTTGPVKPLGSSPYLMLAYCPSLSMSVGSAALGAHPTTTHLSGFQIIQGDLNDFVLYRDGFDRVLRSPSLFSLLGTNFDTYATNGVIWAGEMNLQLLCPQANLVGARYAGSITLASIPVTGLDFAKLIQLSSEVQTASAGLTLKGSLVNNNLVTTALTPNSNDSFADFSNEIVHFYVLQTPVISITTGSSSVYSMIGTGRGNYAWWPTAADAFANKIGSSATSDTPDVTKGKSWLQDTIVDPLLDVAAAWVPGLGNVAKKLANMAIGGIGRMVMPAINNFTAPVRKAIGYQALKKVEQEGTVFYEKAWVLRYMNETREALSKPALNVFLPLEAQLLELIDRYYPEILNYPSSFIPADLFQTQVNADSSRFLEPILRRK